MDNAITGNFKTRNFAVMLYPDNPYHMHYLEFLKTTHDGFYILHEKGADNFCPPIAGYKAEQHDEKPHFHVVVRFKNPRTVSGFLKKIPFVKYYRPLQLENINNETKQRLFNVYDVSCVDIPCEEIYKPLIEYAEPISDIYGYCQYLLHRDFDSFVKGKKQYEYKDIKPLCCEVQSYSEYFEQTECTDNSMLEIILEICSMADGNKNMFVQLVQMHSNPKVLKYVQNHAYFIDKYVLSPNKAIAEMEYKRWMNI